MKRHIVIDARVRRSSTGRYADELVNHLQDVDNYNNYTVLVAPDDDWKMRAGNFRTVPSPFPQFSFNPLNELRFAWQLYCLKPDLVHFTMTQQPLLYFGKIVTTTHDLTMFQYAHPKGTHPAIFWIKMRLYHFLMWLAHRKSRRIIVPTHHAAGEVAEFQPFTKDKLVVTYESVGVPLNVTPKRPEVVPDNYIMYQGTGFPHKNLPKLVEAFDILHPHYPDLYLVFVGKKEKHYNDLEREIKRHPSASHIIVAGFLPDPESKWTFQHARVYATPSLAEGWGMTPLEAMANGAPVVSSNASAMPEVYGEGALYCDPHSAQDIADKIAMVLDDAQLRKDLIQKGTAQYQKYSWATMAKQTLDIYEDVLAPENGQHKPKAI
ncbi:MAG TPA: glycosyltransferase family 1 protein [Patescibacteria group bacterium]|nr:glycosyltransferase family 1 protein [Patescibacteria group bacterium]